MKNESAIVRNVDDFNNNIVTFKDEEVIVFDKDAVKRDMTIGLKQFGRGCCDAGEKSLAPLAYTMTQHFFHWLKYSILQ